MTNKYFELAMVLATLAGFAGIIYSIMFSTVYQIQSQKIEVAKIYMDLYSQHPEQVNQTQVNETAEAYTKSQNDASNFADFMLILGLVLFAFSLYFAIMGFRYKGSEDSNIKKD